MALATYKCPKCGEQKEVSFKVGNPPLEVKCEKDGEQMKRLFKNIGVGDVITDSMMSLSNMQ